MINIEEFIFVEDGIHGRRVDYGIDRLHGLWIFLGDVERHNRMKPISRANGLSYHLDL